MAATEAGLKLLGIDFSQAEMIVIGDSDGQPAVLVGSGQGQVIVDLNGTKIGE